MRDRDEVRALKDTKRTFDMIKEKHQHMLEELKGRLTESEDDKSRMRERLQGEVEKEKVFAISKFAKDIIEIFDNLERAMSHATEAEKSGNMYKGLELTHSQGLQTLNRFNIKPMEDPVGKKFDTNFHEVVFEQTNPKHDAGTVFHVMRKGYLIKDRLLRTATVGVTKKD
jgi:molecular chaperone GrpE